MAGAPSRIAGHGPISVIDIGSNSVRLVAYERLSRAPTPIFNEKALCGLGKGLAETDMLDDDAVERAIAAIHRFKAISDQLASVELFVLATAACRDAKNGDDFIERVAEVSGSEPMILSGEDEARLSGYGIMSGIYQADGVIGDMGGGSLEIARLKDNTLGEGDTFGLGGLRLQDLGDESPKNALAIARDALKDDPILAEGKGTAFYAIGGTWRSLAMLHMRQEKYPLHVLHHYVISAKRMAKFCEMVVKSDLDDLDGIEHISKNRMPLLPYGAAVLLAVIEEMKPKEVIISALGVREGLLYEQLPDTVQHADPLVEGARELSLLRSRSPENATELVAWMGDLFKTIGWSETPEERRLRVAACLLSDVGWRAHPDYRGQQSVNIIAHAPFIGIDHPGRAFVALAAYFRHEGQLDDDELPDIAQLIEPDMLLRARMLGVSFRLAHLISASMADVLPLTHFVKDEETLVFQISEDHASHVGERLIRRLSQVGKLIDLKTEIKVGDWR